MKVRSSVLLFVVAVSGILLVSSCNKNYTCQCTIKYSGSPGLPDSTATEYKVYNTKSGAKALCEDESFEHVENGIKVVETCTLY
jgi:hypothetical protein